MRGLSTELVTSKILDRIGGDIQIDQGLLDSIGFAIVHPMAKWIISEEREAETELLDQLLESMAPGWLAQVEIQLVNCNSVLQSQKRTIIKDSFSLEENITPGMLRLVGDFHGKIGSTLCIEKGLNKTFIKPIRHYETGVVFDMILDNLDFDLPRFRDRLVKTADTHVVEVGLVDEGTSNLDYFSFGNFAVVCYLLGIVDLHSSNVIISGGKPVLLDPECMFNSPGFGRKQLDIESLAVLSLYRTGLFGLTRHLREAGVVTTVQLEKNWKEFSLGVSVAVSTILRNLDGLRMLIDDLDEIKIRRLPRETALYYNTIQDIWHPLVVTGKMTKHEILSRLYDLPSNHPFMQIRSIESSALLRCEIPIFFANTKSGLLLNEGENSPDIITEVSAKVLFEACISLLIDNDVNFLLRQLRRSLGLPALHPETLPSCASDLLHSEIQQRISFARGRHLIYDMHLEPNGPSGVKAIGPGILFGAGGMALTCHELDNEELVKMLANYALNDALEVSEEGGYGLFAGPLSGLLAFTIISQTQVNLQPFLFNRVSHVLEAHKKERSSNKFDDLSHGTVGSLLILRYLEKIDWLGHNDLIQEAISAELEALPKSVYSMLEMKFQGISHGCESLCFIWNDLKALAEFRIDEVCERINEDFLSLRAGKSLNWCNGLTGFPVLEWQDLGVLEDSVDEYHSYLNEKSRVEEIDFNDVETWFPCHGAMIALQKAREHGVISSIFSKPNTVQLIRSTPLNMSYGTGISGVISISEGNISWLDRLPRYLCSIITSPHISN